MADKGRNGELSLFDIFEEEGKEVIEKKLNVVRADFIEVEQMAWKELFSGYNKLWAITYSSGINFVYSLLDMFDEAEVIFGFEKVISPSLHDIIAYQNKVIERMRNKMGKKKERLLDKIDSEAVRFFVAHEKLSHEKIYLLQADNGDKRVITGSANMSFNAFAGKQRESIIVMDGDAAFDSYLEIFEELQINSTDIISRKALEIADLDEHIEQLPILDAIKKEKVTVIEAITGEDEEEIQFVLDVQDIAKRLQPNMPKMEKSGIIRITPTEVARMKKRVCDVAVKEKERLSEKPQLIVDVFDKTVSLNGKPYNLEPSKDEIKADVELFLQYMDGYNKFHGDSNSLQRQYYIFANWFFCSPFMATMRTLALNSDHNPLPYPVFGLVYGQSKAGKTSFLETLLKMMIGQKPKMAAPDFTHSVIEALKMEVKGAPIIVDDLTNTRFTNHAIEMIKNESFGVNERLFHYPAVVISANEDVKAVAPEIRRRTVVCRVEAGLTNTEVMRSNTVRTVQKKIGTAFYREYIRRMFEQIPDLIEALQKENGENMPDILKVSSEVLYCIIQDYVGQLPHYVVPLTIENYFSEKVTGKFVIDTIKNAWATNKRNFKIDKKNNKLSYDAGDVVDSNGKIIKESDFTLKKKTGEHLEEKKPFLTEHSILNRKEKIASLSRTIKDDLDSIDKLMPTENQGLQKESFEVAMIGLAYFNLCKIVCSSTTKNKALKLLLDITDTKVDGKQGIYPFSDIANDKELQKTLETLTYGKNGVSFFDVQLAGACHTHNEQSIMSINTNFLDMMQLWAAECEETMATTDLRAKVMKDYSDIFSSVSEKHWGKSN